MIDLWIRIAGVMDATEIGAHTPPTWETLADGGNGPSSFDLAISSKVIHPLLKPGTQLEIISGGCRLWLGRISDYDRSTGRVVGRGIHTDAYGFPAIDGSGNVTRNVLTALNVAASTPWNWFVGNPNSISGSALGDSTNPQTMGALLDEFAAQDGKRWGQNANGGLYVEADPIIPMWLATPDTAAFGSTDEDSPTYLIGRYSNGTSLVTTTRSVAGSTVARAEFRDLTGRNILTTAQANAILDAELASTTSSPSWVNGVTLHREQLTTEGGSPAFLASVRARTMMRCHGLLSDAVIQAPWLDVVIGKTRYTAGSDSIYLEPANVVPRTLTDVIAAS